MSWRRNRLNTVAAALLSAWTGRALPISVAIVCPVTPSPAPTRRERATRSPPCCSTASLIRGRLPHGSFFGNGPRSGHVLSYVSTPASFERTGQKVRTTAAVLSEQLGNCLDLSVTYTACLEAAGLHPLVVLVSGHAFAGSFLAERRLPEAVSLGPDHLINLVDSMTFAAALRAAKAHFRGDDHELLGMVDIALAHRNGIKALPSGAHAMGKMR